MSRFIGSQIKLWSLQSNISYIATPAQSWIDDYVAWLEHCCTKDEVTGEYCEDEGTGAEDSSVYGDAPDYRVVRQSFSLRSFTLGSIH